LQAEKEERERRRQEALAAKRYPIDDLELLAEELAAAAAQGRAGAKAAAAGGTAAAPEATCSRAVSSSPPAAAKEALHTGHALLPSEQLDLVCLSEAKHLSDLESLQLGQVLYVADTLSQFARQLKVKGCSYADLKDLLAAAAPAAVSVAESSSSGGTAGASAAEKGAKEVTDVERKGALQWLAFTYQQLLKVRAAVQQITFWHFLAEPLTCNKNTSGRCHLNLHFAVASWCACRF